MKTKLITVLLLLSTVYLKAQNATAYAYFFVLNNLSGKDVYLFTSPNAFTYAKGSTYVFLPVEYEHIAKLTNKKKGALAMLIDTGKNTVANRAKHGLRRLASLLVLTNDF